MTYVALVGGYKMRRKSLSITAVMIAAAFVMTACGQNGSLTSAQKEVQSEQQQVATENITMEAMAADASKYTNAVQVVLSDEAVTVNGEVAGEAIDAAVYVSHDIIYYEDKDTYESGNLYGEGTDKDKHSADEAAAHTVVNITQPGTYLVTGKLSAGQIFVNVGEEETDKVTLILNGIDITCTVAPAVMFYEVYECDADASEESATYEVDTTNVGAKVVLADGSVNNVTGSYVARIYKDNEEEKKLHKYDGAFYSKMSMEIAGGEEGSGILNIHADNEGLDSEMHLTINGGNINIKSLNDGINVNEDGISVCTINSGNLNIESADGEEGDGIDSNGWLVINGGNIIASSNPKSQDAGIDSDMGIYINGGTVIACGNMYDHVEDGSTANMMVLQFQNSSKGNYTVKDEKNTEVFTFECVADYSNIVISSEKLMEGTYYIYNGDTQLSYTGNGMMGMGPRPDMGEGEMPEMKEGEMPTLPEGEVPQKPDGGKPENDKMPEMKEDEKPTLPQEENGQKPGGDRPQNGKMQGHGKGQMDSAEKTEEFVIGRGVNVFGGVTE